MKLVAIFILTTLFIYCTEPNNPPNNDPDTTSHDFHWTIDTIGTNGSMLKDVAFIDENDIWVVGEIRLDEEQDSFNAAHWNGDRWELHHVPAVTNYGTITKMAINTVFAFAEDDIWMFSLAGSYAHWNGAVWESAFVNERIGSINKIWGTSSNNLYFVGNHGNITHYDRNTWKLLESSTDIHFRDIWGDYNKELGKYEILAIASNDPRSPQARQLFEIDIFQVNPLASNNLPLSLRSIWFRSGVQYYLVGDGIFIKEPSDSIWFHDESHPLLYKEGVRGNDSNDVFIVGAYGLVSHFNGSTWKQYQGNELPEFYGTYGNLHFKDDFIVTVGWINNSAIILRGKRN